MSKKHINMMRREIEGIKQNQRELLEMKNKISEIKYY